MNLGLLLQAQEEQRDSQTHHQVDHDEVDYVPENREEYAYEDAQPCEIEGPKESGWFRIWLSVTG